MPSTISIDPQTYFADLFSMSVIISSFFSVWYFKKPEMHSEQAE